MIAVSLCKMKPKLGDPRPKQETRNPRRT